jgi:hypothetical protein
VQLMRTAGSVAVPTGGAPSRSRDCRRPTQLGGRKVQLSKMLCTLFAEHSWYPLAFGAFVGDQRREPIPRGYFQYFFHLRTAPLTRGQVSAVASLFF